MRCLFRFSCRRQAVLAVALMALACAESRAIEMFTYFGDGSRVGLPSLEVPIEAYPGIPLRSDRLRARRRAMRMSPANAVPAAPHNPSRTITIRTMPQAIEAPQAVPLSPTVGLGKPTTPATAPVAPSPEEVALPPHE